MKQFLLIALTILTFNGMSQVFYMHQGSLQLYKDTSRKELLNEDYFKNCWCDEVVTEDMKVFFYPKKEDKGRILAQKSSGWGILSRSGEAKTDFTSVNPYTYDAASTRIELRNFEIGDYAVEPKENSYLAKLDTSGKEIKKYFVRDDYKGHFLASEDEDDWGISNVNMRTILRMNYDPARYDFTNFKFNDNGLVVLESKGNDNKYGVVTYKGQIQIGFRFDFMIDYITNEDTIYAEINGKKGYINKHGGVVFSLIHEKCPMVWTDSNLVATEKKVWIVDRNYRQIKDYRWQILEREGDVYMCKKNNVWGIMDRDLNYIVKPQYTSIDDGPRIKGKNDFKTYVVVKNGKIGVIDLKGNVIIPCKYNCRCTLGYFSPAGYFIELANGDKAYRFDETGKVVEETSAKGKACLCESYE